MATLARVEAWRRSRGGATDKPFRDELLSSARLEDRALALAAHLTVDGPRRRTNNIFPRFRDNGRSLKRAYRTLSEDVRAGEFVSPASEWLLDNYHLVASEITDIQRNLPGHYYRHLPSVAATEHAGEARAYVIAVDLLRYSDSRLDRPQLITFLTTFQRVAPLSIGELWAWPSMLRLALIENLRRLADEILEAREARLAADEYVAHIGEATRTEVGSSPTMFEGAFVVQLLHRLREYGLRLQSLRESVDLYLTDRETTAEEVVRDEHHRQATLHVSVANVITSLRLCATLDWRQFFEKVSLVEQVLQRDPAGVYERMDFLSRDRQRQAVEELAAKTGGAQMRVALKAVESARRAAAAAGAGDRSAHVGYHLIGKGRGRLEADIAYRPPVLERVRRILFAHATAVYLGPIVLLTMLLVAVGVAYARWAGGGLPSSIAAFLLLLIPASDMAVSIVNRVVAWAVPPRRLPRLDTPARCRRTRAQW